MLKDLYTLFKNGDARVTECMHRIYTVIVQQYEESNSLLMVPPIPFNCLLLLFISMFVCLLFNDFCLPELHYNFEQNKQTSI